MGRYRIFPHTREGKQTWTRIASRVRRNRQKAPSRKRPAKSPAIRSSKPKARATRRPERSRTRSAASRTRFAANKLRASRQSRKSPERFGAFSLSMAPASYAGASASDRRPQQSQYRNRHHSRPQPSQRDQPWPRPETLHDFLAAHDEHHGTHDRDGHDPVEHGAPDEHLDRIERAESQCQADDGGCRDNAVKSDRIRCLRLERGGPPERIGDRIGGRAGENRNGEQAGADDAEREHQEGQFARERPQRIGRVGSRVNVFHPVRVEHRRGRENDEEGDSVGKNHADRRVERYPVDLRLSSARKLTQRTPYLSLVHLLDFLSGLPKEQIGTYRGAEDSDQHQEIVRID